ncbi:MAG: 4Fe-4S binding protein [Dorea sp.]
MEDKCKQCLLCVPVCPDSCIPVKDMKRGAFDYDHCKGCGICVKACPFGAITMEGVK